MLQIRNLFKYIKKQDKIIIGDLCNIKSINKNLPNNCYVVHFAANHT